MDTRSVPGPGPAGDAEVSQPWALPTGLMSRGHGAVIAVRLEEHRFL